MHQEILIVGSVLLLLLAGCAGPSREPKPTHEDIVGYPAAVESENKTHPPEFPPWPAISSATVRPGTVIESESGSCTSNFLFRSPDNVTLYLGLAAHCVDGIEINGTVDIEGASEAGRLAYSSWVALNATGCAAVSSAPPDCEQDFALIALDSADRPKVHPAVLYFGGPVAVKDSKQLSAGDRVLTYGRSPLRGGVEPSNPREGVVTMEQSGPKFLIATATPGVPGDSGSAVMTKRGEAVGVLVDVQVAPFTGQNGVVGLVNALEVAAEKGGIVVEVVTWPQLDSGLKAH